MSASVGAPSGSGMWLAVVLMCVQLATLTISLLASDTSFVIWRAFGIATGILAVVSAVVGVGMVVRGFARRVIRSWSWGLVLLTVNVLPYIAIMIAAEVAGLP